MKPTLLLVLALCATACMSQKQPGKYAPTPTTPKVLDFSYGGAFSGGVRFVADGVQVRREESKPRRILGKTTFPVTTREARPSGQQWSEFWGVVDRLAVAHWKREYTPQDLGLTIDDGMQWEVTLSTLRHSTKSKGDNTYPMLGNPRKTTENRASFDQLQQAFEALLTRPRS